MHRILSILRDHIRILSLPEFIVFLISTLFKNDRILIYKVDLQKTDCSDLSMNLPGRITKGELNQLASIRNEMNPVPWEFKCDLYDGVEDFFVFQSDTDGIIGHVSWLYFKGDPNRILRLGEKDCEIKFCLTLPNFRGQGLYPLTLQAIQRYLRERDYERCFICVMTNNLASIRGIEKSGFELASSVNLHKIFGVQISRKCRVD